MLDPPSPLSLSLSLSLSPCVSPSGGRAGSAEGWKEEARRAVLPVAIGHGIVNLLLLQKLRDGQQLFQHVLQGNGTWNKTQGTLRHHVWQTLHINSNM